MTTFDHGSTIATVGPTSKLWNCNFFGLMIDQILKTLFHWRNSSLDTN